MQIFKRKRRKILCVIPSASINGAVVVLMHFFAWLTRTTDENEIVILVQWGKEGSPDAFFQSRLSEFGKVTLLEELNEESRENLKKGLLKEDFDCIFYNSIISVETQKFLHEIKAPRIYFVHEMERMLHLFRTDENLHLYNGEQVHFIACSASVKSALKKVLRIKDSQITIIYEFIDINKILNELKGLEAKKSDYPALMAGNQVDPGENTAITIGFSGTFELRKSADLLPALVLEIRKRIKNPTIIWVGASPFNGEPGTFDMVMNDVRQADLADKILFIPKGLGHYKYYKRFDIFVMLSREDPFPVVNLEMGALGIPTICFEKSGGSQEYAEMGGGLTAPFMDLGAMADQIHSLYKNPGKLKEYKRLLPEIIDKNFTSEVQAPKIYEIICKLTSSK
ncbi:MAG TPA: glycosyltransferase family 4 protein [Puia sp.]